ncbi:hypothetical protein [Leptolyngbya sp. NK1-12]|nr:hypothetical protein [Leptolyngbya sp. NK1-12]
MVHIVEAAPILEKQPGKNAAALQKRCKVFENFGSGLALFCSLA